MSTDHQLMPTGATRMLLPYGAVGLQTTVDRLSIFERRLCRRRWIFWKHEWRIITLAYTTYRVKVGDTVVLRQRGGDFAVLVNDEFALTWRRPK